MQETTEQPRTANKFAKTLAGLQGGNSLETKPVTIQHIAYASKVTGEMQTFIVQTIRLEDGDYVALTIIEDGETVQAVIPPRVTRAIARQAVAVGKKDDARKKKIRSDHMKNVMRERMANGFIPSFVKK